MRIALWVFSLVSPISLTLISAHYSTKPKTLKKWFACDVTVSDGAAGTFSRRFAGHVENGRPSYSDPAAVRPVSAA